MARGQEETSTSQVGRRRGPNRELPFERNLVSSMAMEELRSNFLIPNNISLELSDGPAASTVGEANSRLFYQGAVRSRTSLPYFIIGEIVSTRFLGISYAYSSECHSDFDGL